MSKATYPLKLPLSIKKAAQPLAKEDGVSLNQWIAAAVAEKVGVVETAAEFFKKRAGKATGEGLMKFLRTAPKLAPEPEDATIGGRRPSQDGLPPDCSSFSLSTIIRSNACGRRSRAE